MTEHPPAGGPLAHLDYQSTGEGYRRYASWRQGELIMRKHACGSTAPKLDLQLLVNLESVETIGLQDLSVIIRKPWQRWHGLWKVGPASRRHFETGLLAGHIVHGWYLYPTDPTTRSHLQTMLIALDQSKTHLTCLKLQHVEELLRCTGMGESDTTLIFPHLQHLHVDTSRLQQYTPNAVQPQELSSWVKSLRCLKTLTLVQHAWSTDEPDLIAFLAKTHFPALAEINLYHARTSFAALANFVAQHFDTLEYIKIIEPAMSADKWALLRSGLMEDGERKHHGKKMVLSEKPF